MYTSIDEARDLSQREWCIANTDEDDYFQHVSESALDSRDGSHVSAGYSGGLGEQWERGLGVTLLVTLREKDPARDRVCNRFR